MAKPKPVKHFSKVPAKDLPGFFAKLNGDGGERMSHLALRWTMLTMVRSQETRFAEWSEFDWIEHQLAHQHRGVRAAYNAANISRTGAP